MLVLPSFAVSSRFINTSIDNVKSYRDITSSNGKTIWVPYNYTTIQEAIDNANDGDTILVESGTYYENIVLGKSVDLIGENEYTTIIDGKGSGNVIKVMANGLTIEGFTFRNGEVGIHMIAASNCLLRGNIVKNNQDGIDLASCSNCTIIESDSNNNNYRGIYLGNSWNCIVEDNIVEKNEGYGINLWGSQNCSVLENFVRGGQKDWDAIGLYNCENCVVVGNTARDSHWIGIWLESSIDCLVDGNYATNNWYGISVDSSTTECIIKRNDVQNNRGYNLGLHSSNTNMFHHNNFVTNTTVQVESIDSVNMLDNGVEGNYWSDYNGTDSDGNGIGNSAYIIDTDERDNHPLMARLVNFSISRPGETQSVEVISNSTVSNFEYDADKKEIRLEIVGEDRAYGFCRIGIPKVLMDGIFVIKIDGNAPLTQKKLEQQDVSYNYLYFTYVHSMHQVTITLETNQFSLLQFLPLILIALVAAIAISALVLVSKKKKLHLHTQQKK